MHVCCCLMVGVAARQWMEIEKERGISISSTALTFPYNGFQMNLLDTPG